MAKEIKFNDTQQAIFVLQAAKANYTECQNKTGIDFSKLIAESDKMEKDLVKGYKKQTVNAKGKK